MIIKIRGKNLKADHASTLWKKAKGLSFTDTKKNMLFTFPYSHKWSFWMLGTRFHLQIIFIDKNRRVVDIQNAIPMKWHPNSWRIYRPRKSCKYVLEVHRPIKIRIGDVVSW